MFQDINIKGAAQHNLKNIDVTIPRNKLTVITGLSGSGKSSLAFDTLYAEGQRRYVESLSAYARQFLDRMQKPKVEHIEGLSPAISIEQRSSSANPRSTVATTTEIYDYLRLLYAHVGIPHCPNCNAVLKAQSPQAICEKINSYPEQSKLMILAPYIIGRKGEHRDVFAKMRADGFVRARIDGQIKLLDGEEITPLEKNVRHTIEAVVDRLVVGRIDNARLSDSVETALELGDGLIHLLIEDVATKKWVEEQISEHLACVKCDISFPKMQPRNFSFNSPYGACQTCHGLGSLQVMDPDLVIEDKSLSISKGLFPGLRRGPRRLLIYYNHLFKCLAEYFNYPKLLTTAYNKLPKNIQHTLLYGTKDEIVFDYHIRRKLYKMRRPFEGVLALLQKRVTETESDAVRERLKKYQSRKNCPECNGARLNEASLAVTVGDLAINEFNALSIDNAHEFILKLTKNLNEEEKVICSEIVKEIGSRLQFLIDVGLNYLTLDRESGTLSGGEAQRIKLATQLGCGLVGVLYILDEPSIGLHQRDNDKLLDTLVKLRDIGNTVIVVEHDLDTIMRADCIIDIGPGAGVHGGEIVGIGNYKKLMKCKKSLTGKYISGELNIAVPEERLTGSGNFIEIIGAEQNNLKNVDVKIPLGTFCCITGVSGSGKSSLINETLVKALHQHFNIKTSAPGIHKEISGLENIGKAIVIDQSPIGRTPRSNAATYTDAFTPIRKLFSETKEAKVRGYKPGRFSFNVKGGRCEDCKGDGIKKIAMQFLPDVYVSCSSCSGRRFNQETLSVYYKKKNIADVLEMTIDEAVEFFDAIPTIYRKLKTLQDVGLGYIQLGQSATTLSGGEAQRVKLASELAKVARDHTIYILDEPTTGLHMKDIEQLLKVLNTLRDKDNTVLVIEHNLDVIKVADYIIDLGPEGGNSGGEVVAKGTPEEVAKVKKSYTGKYLQDYLK
ncbi:excinuclease ABC subunit UvrA [Lentisphaerota bacterium WC36G]|nr:excinuclease ABC subunit UvrA [Lentisphaerae bacterium WC36]